MREEIVEQPSFPPYPLNKGLLIEEKMRWQVLCGDEKHWRVGIYSPEFGSPEEIHELEKHSCPEFFYLIEGKLSLLLFHEESATFEVLDLKEGEPVMVETWHNGFCPNGPFTGRALVIERDNFKTTLKTKKE